MKLHVEVYWILIFLNRCTRYETRFSDKQGFFVVVVLAIKFLNEA